MSSAMLLAHHGIRALCVEHHRGTAIHPRAAMISQRTMEILREAGIEGIVRRESETQFDQDGAIMAVETLAGKSSLERAVVAATERRRHDAGPPAEARVSALIAASDRKSVV